MPVTYAVILRVRDWAALHRHGLEARASAVGAVRLTAYRNRHDASEALLVVDLPDDDVTAIRDLIASAIAAQGGRLLDERCWEFTPWAQEGTMTIDQNKAIVRQFFAAMDAPTAEGVWAACSPLLGVEYVNYGFGQPLDREATIGAVTQMKTAFPDLQVEILDQIADEESVATRYIMRGTHRGDFQGIAPTGRTVAMPGTSVHRIAGGVIVEDRPGMDSFALIQQLS